MEFPPICPKCKNKDLCAEGFLCPAVDLLTNNDVKPLKEYLGGFDSDSLQHMDYKDVLKEQQEARQNAVNPNKRVKQIKALDDNHIKIIAAALFFKISVTVISQQLNISRQTIYKHIKDFQLDTFFKDNPL